jgi:hypothetical protein
MAVALQDAPITSPNEQITFTCPASQLVNPAHVVIYNKSSYELILLNQLIPAWGIVPIDVGAILGGSPTIILTAVLADNVVVAPVATVYAQWLDASEDVPDSWSFIADAISAAITGEVALDQGQVFLGTFSPVFTSTGNKSVTFLLPVTSPLNALMLLGEAPDGVPTGSWRGQQVWLQSTSLDINYYSGQPLANWDSTPYEVIVRVAAYPGSFETGGLRLTVRSVGASAGINWTVVGFEGTSPPYAPPLVVASTAYQGILGGSTIDLLPALTDGRSYRIWSASIQATGATPSSSGAGSIVYGSGGADTLMSIAPLGAVSNTYPKGINVGGEAVRLDTSSLSLSYGAAATVAYDYLDSD